MIEKTNEANKSNTSKNNVDWNKYANSTFKDDDEDLPTSTNQRENQQSSQGSQHQRNPAASHGKPPSARHYRGTPSARRLLP